MNEKDRAFIKSLPRYPMQYVGKLPDAVNCMETEFELKDKDGNELIKVKKEFHVFEDGTRMGYWAAVNKEIGNA